jgi:hypothetical protein
MPALLRAARQWVDQIHLNAASRAEHAGRHVMVKRRRRGAGLAFAMANAFFRAAHNPVVAITSRAEWQNWEVDCFQRLHGPEFSAGFADGETVWIDWLPGESLGVALGNGRLSSAMLESAALELRRAHAQQCPHYQGAWSHGDPHLGNFLYDEKEGRARLIDFEVRHLRHLSAEERHADDLLVVLQDVCGRCRAEDWPVLASAFVNAYGRPEIVARLRAKLRVPSGVPRLWWAVRTTWLPRAELERRLLQCAALLHPFAAA